MVVEYLLNALLLAQNSVKAETWTLDCPPLRKEALSVFEVLLKASLLKAMNEEFFLWIWCVVAYRDYGRACGKIGIGEVSSGMSIHPGDESLNKPGWGQVSH